MAKIHIGIDPGKNGGIVVLGEDGNVIEAVKIPPTIGEQYRLFEKYAGPDTLCYLEKVGARPGNGVASMFKFGQEFGWLQMALMATKIRTVEVLPNAWMRGLGVRAKGKDESKTAYKNRLKFMAEQLFPDQFIKLWGADAFLIAHSCYIADKRGEINDTTVGLWQ